MTTDADIHDLAASYALAALDAGERAAFEAHLAGCARCREEVASFGDAVLALAGAAAGNDGDAALLPPASLRSRVLAAVAAERQVVVPIAAARERRRSRLAALAQPRVLAPAFAVAAAVAIALGNWGAGLSGSLDRERAARSADAAALASFADPAASHSATLNASLAVTGGRGALSVARLDPAPPGKVYEAWVIPVGGQPIPAGLFTAQEGRVVLTLTPTVSPGAVVAITIEPVGGSDAPTSHPVLSLAAAQV